MCYTTSCSHTAPLNMSYTTSCSHTAPLTMCYTTSCSHSPCVIQLVVVTQLHSPCVIQVVEDVSLSKDVDFRPEGRYNLINVAGVEACLPGSGGDGGQAGHGPTLQPLLGLQGHPPATVSRCHDHGERLGPWGERGRVNETESGRFAVTLPTVF